MEEILIVPIGPVDADILKDIAKGLKSIFHDEVELGKEVKVPEKSYSPGRRQYHSTTVLKDIEIVRPKGFSPMLCVTEIDLYVPGLNFVFGEADPSSKVAIISLARLRQEFYGLHPNKELLHLRANKEGIHEIGHTYGLGHCTNPKCIMYFSNSISDTDIKGPGFCNKCRSKLDL